MDKYYNILELQNNASKDEIKKAYKKLAIKYHPDKQSSNMNDEDKKNAEAKFKEIAEAYDILMNPEKFNNNSMPANFRHGFVDPNQLFNQIFRDMNIHNDLFSSRMNINIGNMRSNMGNNVVRSSSVTIINGQKIEKITETINGVTRVQTVVSGSPSNNFQNIRINFN